MLKKKIELKLATLSDAQQLFEWRNDPATRAASHDTKELLFCNHTAWLEKTLKNPNRKLYLAFIDNTPIGTVRADLDGKSWEISWTVAPDQRGLGIGKWMVLYFASTFSDPISARVKSTNIASANIAKAAGMRLIREYEGVLYFERQSISEAVSIK